MGKLLVARVVGGLGVCRENRQVAFQFYVPSLLGVPRKFENLKIREFENSRLQEFENLRLREFENLRIPKLENSKI